MNEQKKSLRDVTQQIVEIIESRVGEHIGKLIKMESSFDIAVESTTMLTRYRSNSGDVHIEIRDFGDSYPRFHIQSLSIDGPQRYKNVAAFYAEGRSIRDDIAGLENVSLPGHAYQ